MYFSFWCVVLYQIFKFSNSLFLGSGTPVKSKVDKVAKEKPNIDEFLINARFFIMKSSNYENVSLSKAKVCVQCYLHYVQYLHNIYLNNCTYGGFP